MPETQIAVLLFTDIVGSVGLQSRLGTTAYTRYITRHDEIFKQCLSYVKGASILNETGDGFLVKFSSARDAVETALRLQCLLREEVCEGEPMALCIGIHMGEVSEMDEQITGDKRAVGMAINLCARIMDLATDGQILLTRGVFDDARQYTREHPEIEGLDDDSLPALQWPAHGRYIFKGTDEPMEIYEVGALGLAPLTPPENSAKAQRAVSADEEATLGWRPGAGLPIPRHEKWVIAKKLGQGGFGEVWLATHSDTKDQRVFKFCFDPDKLRSFKRELTLFRLLRDALGKRDDIAALYDVSVESPPFYLESEYVPAGSMSQWAESKGGIDKINLSIRLDLLARTARALAAAHSVGIIHKDIKPSNILIHEANGKPFPRIADFGIGTLSDSANLEDHNITQMGFTESIVIESESGGSGGTQIYMAPEYLIGAPSSIRGDVFSLGVMLYQLVAGDLSKPMGSGWQRDIEDPLLRDDILKCIDIDPERRFENASQLADQLESLADRHDTQRRAEEDEARRAQLQCQAEKRRRLLALGAVALLGLLGVVAALYKGLQEQRDGLAEQRLLKDEAKIMASQADYALANEHLKQGHANVAVAHLARSLRNHPANEAAARRLTATLAYNSFPQRLHPPLQVKDMQLQDNRQLASDVTWDGIYLAEHSGNEGIDIREMATGKSFGVLLENPGDPITHLLFNDASDHLFVQRERGYQIVNIATRDIVRAVDMEKENYGLNHSLSNDGRYWIADHFIEPLWHVHDIYGDKKYLVPDVKGTGQLAHFRATPDGRHLACFWQNRRDGSRPDGFLSICDLHAKEPVWRTIHQGYPWKGSSPDAVSAIDPSSNRIAFGDLAGALVVYDIQSGEKLHTLALKQDFIMTLAFSPAGEHIAAGYFTEQTARIWNLATEKSSSPLPHQGAIASLDYSTDGTRLLTASLDGHVRLWNPSTGTQLSQPMPHESQVISAWFDDTDQRAITMTVGGKASIWDLARIPAYDIPVNIDGEIVAISSDLQRSLVFRNSRVHLQSLDGVLSEHQPTNRPANLRFSEFRGDALISNWVTDESSIISRLSPDGSEEHQTIVTTYPFTVMDYDHHQRRLAGGTTVRFNGINATSALEIRPFDSPAEILFRLEHPGTVYGAQFAPSGRYLLTLSRAQAFVSDLDEAEPTPKKLGISLTPTSFAIAKDTPKALLGAITGDTQLWDLQTQQPLSDIFRLGGSIFLLDLNADATIGVTVSVPLVTDYVFKFQAWNLIDSTPITPPIPVTSPQGVVLGNRPNIRNAFLKLSPDASHAIVGLGRGHIQRIDLYPQGTNTLATEELPAFAEAISGFKVDDATGKPRPLSYTEQTTTLTQAIPSDPGWLPWVEWFMGDPNTRDIAPSSDWTSDHYLKYLLNRTDTESLHRALTLSPNHPEALATLAKTTLDKNPEHLALAEFYVKNALSQIETNDTSPLGHETAFSVASEVCLQLGDLIASRDQLEEARHHYDRALRAAINAYATAPDDPEIRSQLAKTYLRHSNLAEADNNQALQHAYLEAAIMTLALLKADGESLDSILSEASNARWEFAEGQPLITAESLWHYATTEQDSLWKNADYDHSGWSRAQAPIGYGDDFANTTIEGNPETVYLRHSFTLTKPKPAKDWLLKILYDDGVTVYLDGEVLHLENMTREGKVLSTMSSPDEGKYHPREVLAPSLAAGAHTLSVAVHQIEPSSSDLMIDLAVFPDADTLAGKLLTHNKSTIDSIADQLGGNLPPNWIQHWHFYHADVADAANPLAQQPGPFYHRALVQESRGNLDQALAAAKTAIRLSTNDPESPWPTKANIILTRLKKD